MIINKSKFFVVILSLILLASINNISLFLYDPYCTSNTALGDGVHDPSLISYSSGDSFGNIIVVDDDGDGQFVTISEAIENANPYDTICVYNGTYDEDLLIDVDNLTLLGFQKEYPEDDGEFDNPLIIGIDSNFDVIKVEADFCNILNFSIRNDKKIGNGILLSSIKNSICDNTIVSKNNGILISEISSNNYIYSNNIITDSYSNGIAISKSNENIIINNKITNIESKLFSDGIYVLSSSNNNLINNIVNNFLNGISIQSSINICIESNLLEDNSVGINLESCNLCFINDNILNNNGEGIFLDKSSNNEISFNNIGYSKNNGLYIYDLSSDNEIFENTIHESEYYGILFVYSKNNQVYNNTIEYNRVGVYTWEESNENIFFNNIFQKNIVNAEDRCSNHWHFGGVGNWWDDYLKKDGDGNGIGEVPYAIPPRLLPPFNFDEFPIGKFAEYVDILPPDVRLQKPLNGRWYFSNSPIPSPPIGITVIIGIVGGIDVEVYAKDNPSGNYTSGMECVYFYVDGGIPKHFDVNEAGSPFFSWLWSYRIFGFHTLEVVGYDKAGNSDSESIEVFIFNMF